MSCVSVVICLICDRIVIELSLMCVSVVLGLCLRLCVWGVFELCLRCLLNRVLIWIELCLSCG